MYKIISDTTVQNLDTGDFIPIGVEALKASRDYAYWLSLGNIPEPAKSDKEIKMESIQNQINTLEAQQTPRRIREAITGIDNGWLKALEDQIEVLRTQLKEELANGT